MAKKAKRRAAPVKVLRDIMSESMTKSGMKNEVDWSSDKSGSWIDLHKDGITVTIEFDFEGKVIEGILVHKDVIQVVDQKKIISI